MKKLFALLAAMVMTVAANAQFEEGKGYLNASVTSLDLNYSKNENLSFGLGAKAGYFIMDNIQINADIETYLNSHNKSRNAFSLGVGGRYYIIQNGIYLGAGLEYSHVHPKINDIRPNVEIGYAFFLNRYLTVEPSIYYKHSFKNTDNSKVGIKVGFGLYFDNIKSKIFSSNQPKQKTKKTKK